MNSVLVKLSSFSSEAKTKCDLENQLTAITLLLLFLIVCFKSSTIKISILSTVLSDANAIARRNGDIQWFQVIFSVRDQQLKKSVAYESTVELCLRKE